MLRVSDLSAQFSPARPVSMITSLLSLLSLLTPPAAAQYASCPEPYGLQVYPHDQYCDKFYKCANGKLGPGQGNMTRFSCAECRCC